MRTTRTVFRFKYLRNVQISLDTFHPIPHRQVPIRTACRDTDLSRVRETGEAYRFAMTSHFDLDAIHVVELFSETPEIPEKTPEMSQAYWEKLRDACLDESLDRKRKNDLVRARLIGYSQPSTSIVNGVEITIPPALEIIDTPEEIVEEVESDWDKLLKVRASV